MAKNSAKSPPPKNLVAVWPYIEWLDRARHRISTNEFLIPGPVFKRLDSSNKILVRWLCYIMDAQMDYRRLWAFGGPVISELVEAYSADSSEPLDIFVTFVHEPPQRNKVGTLRARKQVAPELNLEITPRYSWMLFSVAATLVTLDHFSRSLLVYLSRHRDFLLRADNGQIPERIAFLLYLLSYSKVPNQSSRLSSKSFAESIRRRSKATIKLLQSVEDLEKGFQDWSRSSKRFHKRLWAALRDYLKNEGCVFYAYFRDALNENNFKPLAKRIDNNQQAIVGGLEVPGDVWNLRFFKRLFDEGVNPKQLRSWFEKLQYDGELPKDAAVERFDISFRYSPRMCDERREQCCVFRKKSDIWEHYCPPRRGTEWKGSRCPVTDHLCGIEYICEPNGCPVRRGIPKDLCQGCRVRIHEHIHAHSADA